MFLRKVSWVLQRRDLGWRLVVKRRDGNLRRFLDFLGRSKASGYQAKKFQKKLEGTGVGGPIINAGGVD